MGVFCLLCNRSDVDAPVYYQRSTSDEVARCVDCGDTLAHTALVIIGILSAMILVLLLWRLMPRGKASSKMATRLKEAKATYAPEIKLKIIFVLNRLQRRCHAFTISQCLTTSAPSWSLHRRSCLLA
jgi:hypothetical protein